MKMESKIQNTGFLISPNTHLFPFTGQSVIRGVSSMITFEIKIWNNEKLYQSMHVSTKVEEIKGKNAKK